ncbi:hypothetical protein DYB26_009558 [Aphanomyces astaci]|uniref:Uncharacterized protein n=1 Tax=Aphanomyces astaci TaxID=112090 RepID=A0A397EP19_APHAT|nr:hypothetical protein DYB26_009558 [Aphanomyces astaci]RHY93814.1 hypothetical protein DYB31_016187 [Aphanomyces astaci]
MTCQDASFLKLGLYAPMLNPIENMRPALKGRSGLYGATTRRTDSYSVHLYHIQLNNELGIEPNRLHVYMARLDPFYVRAENMEDMDVGA